MRAVTASQHRSTRRVRSGTQQSSSTSSGVHQQRAVIGWNGDPPDNWTLLRASDQFEHARSELRDWTFLLVRGVENDEGLWNFHSRFEFTGFPTDYLYGPCSYLEAL